MNLNARSRAALAVAVAVVALLGGCERAPAGPAQTVKVPATPVAEQTADGAVAVPACAEDCGEGVSATIQCAAGEIAECSCDEDPRARCIPPEMGN